MWAKKLVRLAAASRAACQGRLQQVEDGMPGEGEQIEGGERHGEKLLAVPEIMFELIAVVFENVEALVLNFPSRKVFLRETLRRIAGIPRCRQSVARRCLNLHRVAKCFVDRHDPSLIEHSVATLVGQRIFGLALGYEDLNDHDPSSNPSRPSPSRPNSSKAGTARERNANAYF